VFVLIPGGTFEMGAQQHDPNGPNHDPDAMPVEEPVHEVRLAPFFLSKYEMTQRQWACLSDGEYPSWHRIGVCYGDDPETTQDSHPVENVSWAACNELLRRFGLALPTEAQWERGCRAGTATPWSTGGEPATLQGYANLRDRSFVVSMALNEEVVAGLDDAYPGVSHVGYFRPNPFGLYDMHGNVAEWCRDRFGEYYLTRCRDGDGLQTGPTTDRCVLRGGNYQRRPIHVRSATRDSRAASFRSGTVGVRPVRPLLSSTVER